jgi:hypothetical protein
VAGPGVLAELAGFVAGVADLSAVH